jgi:hypothetical protein
MNVPPVAQIGRSADVAGCRSKADTVKICTLPGKEAQAASRPRALSLGCGGSHYRSYFELFGYWHGLMFVMNDRGEWSSPFRSGLRVKKASVTLTSGSESAFDAACAAASASR